MKRGEGLKRTSGLARTAAPVAHKSLVAKTGLYRRKPLDPGPPLPRSTPGRGEAGKDSPQRARRRVQLATWADVLEVMYPRDDYRCAGCGTTDGLSGHHRELKQMGSTKRLDLIENALTLCQWRCHPWAHRYRNSEAIARGFCVPQGGVHTDFPVTWFDGSVWLLTPDGERVAA